MGDHLAEMTAVAEDPLRMRFLEVSAAQLTARDVRGDRQHRHAASLAVVQTVDQVQVPGPGTPCAHAQLAREVRFRAGRKGADLLVAHVYPDTSPWLKIASVRPFNESPATP